MITRTSGDRITLVEEAVKELRDQLGEIREFLADLTDAKAQITQ